MTVPRSSSFFHNHLTSYEEAAGFEHLQLVLDDGLEDSPCWLRVAGKEIESSEVIVKAGTGYQLLRFGWLFMPASIRPRPSELSKPSWHLVGTTQPTLSEIEAMGRGYPRIGGPVEIAAGAEIRRA